MRGEDRVAELSPFPLPPRRRIQIEGGCTPSPLPLHHPVGIFCIPPSHILG
jgi:hypothetical protein